MVVGDWLEGEDCVDYEYELDDNGPHQWKRDANGVPRCHDYALWVF